MFFCKARELVIVCHKKSVKWACINAQATEHAFAIIDLRHDGFLVLFPILIDFDHANCLGNSFARYRAELAACALVMEKDVSSTISCYTYTALWIKLISVAYKTKFLFGIAKSKSPNYQVLRSRFYCLDKPRSSAAHLTKSPPGPSTPPYISARATNMLMNESTINLYHPV